MTFDARSLEIDFLADRIFAALYRAGVAEVDLPSAQGVADSVQLLNEYLEENPQSSEEKTVAILARYLSIDFGGNLELAQQIAAEAIAAGIMTLEE